MYKKEFVIPNVWYSSKDSLVKAENVVNDPRNPMIKKFFILSEITSEVSEI